MPASFSGKTLEVITVVALAFRTAPSAGNPDSPYQWKSFAETTHMYMQPYNDDMIDVCLASGGEADHSEALAYQGAGLLLVQTISGCFYNLIGFPAARFYQEIQAIVGEIC